MSDQVERPILFFDGDCGLCSRSVRVLSRMDRSKALYFAPLQGSTAEKHLPKQQRSDLESAVLYEPTTETTETGSDAILNAVMHTRSFWRIPARMALILPKSFRDAIYRWIAQNRHRFFGPDTYPIGQSIPSDQLLA